MIEFNTFEETSNNSVKLQNFEGNKSKECSYLLAEDPDEQESGSSVCEWSLKTWLTLLPHGKCS